MRPVSELKRCNSAMRLVGRTPRIVHIMHHINYMARTVWLTGGMGYIGSHVAVELLQSFPEFDVILIDDLSNSYIETIDRIKQISGSDKVQFVQCDIRDGQRLSELARKSGGVYACIHLAALKNVAESVEIPLDYYDVNIYGMTVLLRVLRSFDCKNFVLSSSCSVYGAIEPDRLPVTEESRLAPICPYAFSKLAQEQLLNDVHVSDPGFSAIVLRYFNPVSAHPSGVLGENPKKTTFNNLFPLIVNSALTGKSLKIFGRDYATVDGTPVRDYIHVLDLACAHIRALSHIADNTAGTLDFVNIGTGRGVTVLELVETFQKINDVEVPHQIADRRQGDVEAIYADAARAKQLLGWSANCSIEQMCKDAWAYALKNQ